MKFCNSFWSWIRSFCQMCNFRSSRMTQKCHWSLWKLTGKELHTTNCGVMATHGPCESAAQINFDNLVIFSWLFGHKLLDRTA
jgi:hypothetical protein